MADDRRCPRCGKLLPSDVKAGICPACLLRAGLEPGSGAAPLDDSNGDQLTISFESISPGHVLESLARAVGTIPRVLLPDTSPDDQGVAVIKPASPEMPAPADRGQRYQLFGEIARGGMGAVLKGRDPDLGRDLAVKVLLESHRDKPDMLRRFVEEAQIGGQLQHPGIVPVYELGTLADSRPYFTMKLVKGRTLAALLHERPGPHHDRPRFLGVFEQVCQTVAYAHARGVIHRDLKPPNIMVGGFGEVQVMDWGLAKVLKEGGLADEPPAPDTSEPAVSAIRTVRSGSGLDDSQAGSILGTPAYMAPEQAGGDVEHVDRRADVFGLGSILCEVLTGQPAYTGRTQAEVMRKATRGDIGEALARLDGCGAEADLVALAKDCLAVEAEDRPRDAGVVVGRMTAYLAGVQERLRAAELARVEAETRAVEDEKRRVLADRLALAERRKRRATIAMAGTILVTVTLAGCGWVWWVRQRVIRTIGAIQAVEKAVADARLQHALARATDAADSPLWVKAAAAVGTAEAILERVEVDPPTRRQAKAVLHPIREEVRAAEDRAAEVAADRRMLERIAEIRLHIPNEFPILHQAEAGYAAAFRDYGIDVDALPPGEAGARIAARRPAAELASVLDEWIFTRRTAMGDLAGARRLLEVARVADPDPWRTRLRAALAEDDLPQLQRLADSIDLDAVPAISAQRLGTGLGMLGDNRRAVALLGELQRRSPGNFWITRDLTLFLSRSEAAPYHESLRFATAALAIRPESHMTHAELAAILDKQGKHREAINEYREALRLKPDSGMVRERLGRSLLNAGRRNEAVIELREALPLVRREEWAGSNSKIVPQELLGRALLDRGEVAGLISAFRRAVENDPRDPSVRHRLAAALLMSGERQGYRRVASKTAEDFRESDDPFIAEAARACLLAPGPPAETAIALRMAEAGLARQPGLPWWLYVLGLAHFRAGHDQEAVARLEESIRRADPGWNALAMNWPVLAMAHHRLGHVAESRRWLAMAHGRLGDPARGLEPGRDPMWGERWWDRADFRILLREADALFPAEDRARDSFEKTEEAAIWYNRDHFAAAARAFAEALDSDPLLSTSRVAQVRYHAACAAALAGAGRGEDQPPPSDPEKARWRKQAVEWLKADLASCVKQLGAGKPGDSASVAQTLLHWKEAPDLTGIRAPEALAKLPADERSACRRLWSEVDALLEKARGRTPRSSRGLDPGLRWVG